MMFFNFLIGFVDVWVAGRLGREVQAPMGMASQTLFFFMVVAVAIANGSVAAISQSMGAGLAQRARRYVGLSLTSGLVFGLAIMAFGLLFLDIFLDIMRLPDTVRPVAKYLLTVFLYILPCYSLFIISNAIFRAQKMVFLPLFGMMVMTLFNTAGDLIFGLGLYGIPQFGFKGIAWSTFFSVMAGTFFNLAALWQIGMLKKTSFAAWRWVRRAGPYLTKVAWPAGLMQVVWHSAYLVLYALVAALPYENVVALAGMSAGIRIESLLFLPGFAFNFTAAILVGHFIGAGDPAGAKRIGYRILGVGLACVSVIALGVWFVLEPLVAFVAPDPAVMAEAMNYLKFNLAGMPFLLIAMILAGAFVGSGATMYQMVIFGISSWLVRLPLAYLLGHHIMKSATGIWLAMLVSMTVQAGIMLYCYQYKDWSRFGMRQNKRSCQPEETKTPSSET